MTHTSWSTGLQNTDLCPTCRLIRAVMIHGPNSTSFFLLYLLHIYKPNKRVAFFFFFSSFPPPLHMTPCLIQSPIADAVWGVGCAWRRYRLCWAASNPSKRGCPSWGPCRSSRAAAVYSIYTSSGQRGLIDRRSDVTRPERFT